LPAADVHVLSVLCCAVRCGVYLAAGEVDLEKEEAAARKAPKPKRQRFERYDDDFIDDSELEMVKGGGPTKTKFSGFYVTQVGSCICNMG
jgi:hypothetical protein